MLPCMDCALGGGFTFDNIGSSEVGFGRRTFVHCIYLSPEYTFTSDTCIGGSY